MQPASASLATDKPLPEVVFNVLGVWRLIKLACLACLACLGASGFRYLLEGEV
jgi:hypothetical protein